MEIWTTSWVGRVQPDASCSCEWFHKTHRLASVHSHLFLWVKIPFSTGKTVVAASAILFLFYLYSFVGFSGAVTSISPRSSERFQQIRNSPASPWILFLLRRRIHQQHVCGYRLRGSEALLAQVPKKGPFLPPATSTRPSTVVERRL